jgi:hypothetical protein
MNSDYLKPYKSWTLWLYNKKGLQQITFNNKSCSTKIFSDLFLACRRSIVRVLNLCKKYCGALIYIIKKERKPTSFSNCRYLELIWIIRKKKETKIYSRVVIDLKFLQLKAFGIIVDSSQIFGIIVDSSQISSTEGIILKYSGILVVSELIKGNHNCLNLCKLRNQLQVLANWSIVSFYKI